jgi:LAO/AO transport system kinase
VLRAAGYGIILIETVGVGQDEGEIGQVAERVVAVIAPGLGDEVQAMKAGLFEVADVVVVNKADREGADRTIRELQESVPCVLATNALTGEGIEALIKMLEQPRWRSGL